MISIIICSRGPEYRVATTESIAATIGVPYELIAVENGQGQYGICEAYNIGAGQAIYPLLCFVHEDIAFRTSNWGKIVEQVLADNSIGAIGVTGGKWLPNAPCTWWSCGNKYLTSNVISEDIKSGYRTEVYSNPENKQVVDVAAVDGMWICVRKEVWQKHPFDSSTFPGFHFYDVDFCANLFPHYRICVTPEIAVTHYSTGTYNAAWTEFADRFYRKHAPRLPLGVPPISIRDEQNLEYSLTESFVQRIIQERLPGRLALRHFGRCLRLKLLARHTVWLGWQLIRYVSRYGLSSSTTPQL